MNKIKHFCTPAILTFLLFSCGTESTDSALEQTQSSPGLPVDVTVVAYRPHQQEERVAGTVLANREVVITSEITRKVVSIHFTDGSHVHQGQLLYKLDDSDIMARLRQTEAELTLSTLTESRLAELLKTESVRQEEYDLAKSRLESLEAAKELIKAELSKTFLVAPFSGTAGISKIQVGSLVTTGLPLVTIQERGTVKVQFGAPEKYLEVLKKGTTIYFTTAGSTHRIPAQISATESSIDVTSRTITVHAVTSNAHHHLKPGMSARVFFPTVPDQTTALTLPTEALIPGANGYQVLVVKNGAAHATPVSIGARNESDALITSGLHDGDTVMISNILRAAEGTPVQIVSVK